MATDSTKTKDVAPQVPTVTLSINGREVTVPKGATVLEAAHKLGIDVPTFCWHPKLKPVGACRMCYVEVEKMPKLQVSCSLPAADGMVVYTDSDLVRQGRKAIIEFTLINHPLDCPTCDKGGECDLQDLTFAHGYDDSRYDFHKMRFVEGAEHTTFDDVRIGPEIILNRNRCILCYKCVRANKEAFGEYDLGAFERGNHTEINAAPGRQVDNPFSGNLVEICPVGALTNTDWRYKIRVWLTSTTASICNYTSSGLNTLFWKETHKNKIFRTTARPNDDVDDGWIPDVSRYGYQVINSPDRLTTPLIKKGGEQVEATWDEALSLIAERISDIKGEEGSVCIGGFAAPNLDNASLYTFNKFMRTVMKSNNIDYRFDYKMLPSDNDTDFSRLCRRPFTIKDIDDSDVIVTLGSDLLREHPNEYLRMRKAYNFFGAKIVSMNPYRMKTDDITIQNLVYRPGTDELLVNALCLAAVEMNLGDSSIGNRIRQKVKPNSLDECAQLSGVDVDDIRDTARILASGKKITFILGELIARSTARDTIAAAVANLNLLLGLDKKGQLAALARYSNSVGAEMLGLAPKPDAGLRDELKAIWGTYPEVAGYNTDAMLVQMRKEEISAMFLMGCNPIMLYPDREFVREGLERLDFLVACDLFETETTVLADVVLPLCSWGEYSGDYVNLEGRSQRALGAIKPIGQARPGYEIVQAVAEKLDARLFADDSSPRAEYERLLKIETDSDLPAEVRDVEYEAEETNSDFPYALYVTDDPHHTGHLSEKATSLANFVGSVYILLPEELAAKLDAKAGVSLRIESAVGKIVAPVKISEHLDNDVVIMPRNFTATNTTSLQSRKRRVDRVKITKVTE